MGKGLSKFVRLHGNQLLALGVTLSTLASSSCRFLWHEPEEPDGIRTFAKEKREGELECSKEN